MPLISQQDIVSVRAGDSDDLIEKLNHVLEDYPPVRIVSMTETVLRTGGGPTQRSLKAVIETV